MLKRVLIPFLKYCQQRFAVQMPGKAVAVWAPSFGPDIAPAFRTRPSRIVKQARKTRVCNELALQYPILDRLYTP